MSRLARLTVVPTDTFQKSGPKRIPIFSIKSSADSLVEYVFRSRLSEGGQAAHPYEENTVSIYYCEKEDDVIVVKTSPYTEVEEVNIIKHISNCPHVTSTRVLVDACVGYIAEKFDAKNKEGVHPKYFNCVLMEHGGATLERAKYMLPKEQKIIALIHLAKMCKTLLEYRLCYLDLKPANITFDKTTHEMRFIDYGSIALEGDANGCATYPPFKQPKGVNIVGNAQNVIYGIGMMFIFLATTETEKTYRYIVVSPKLKKTEQAHIEHTASQGTLQHITQLINKTECRISQQILKNTLLKPTSIDNIVCLLEGMLDTLDFKDAVPIKSKSLP
jgi:hypothetical protein